MLDGSWRSKRPFIFFFSSSHIALSVQGKKGGKVHLAERVQLQKGGRTTCILGVDVRTSVPNLKLTMARNLALLVFIFVVLALFNIYSAEARGRTSHKSRQRLNSKHFTNEETAKGQRTGKRKFDNLV